MSDTKVKGDSIGEWASRLEANDTDWLEILYKDYREAFMQWGWRQHNLEKDDLLDIYQNAMIVLYENIRHNRIDNSEVSVTTYLYGIAKNLIYKYHRKNKMINRHQVRLSEHFQFIAVNNNEAEFYHQALTTALGRMKEPCRTILDLFYIRGLKLPAIVIEMTYSSVDVLKTQKSRCLKKLKESIR